MSDPADTLFLMVFAIWLLIRTRRSAKGLPPIEFLLGRVYFSVLVVYLITFAVLWALGIVTV